MPSLYTLAVPAILRGVKNAAAFLAYAENYAKQNNIDPEEYLSASLYPDMRDFRFQIYRIADFAKYTATRVAKDVDSFSQPDTEQTFPELIAKLQAVIAFLEGVKEEQFEGQDDKEIVVHVGSERNLEIKLIDYINYYNSPNFWFHLTTAYDILRHKGVDVGKGHFLNASGETKITVLQK
ncbi:uncharacterized protein EI97DRAFT_385579 [Westerdykella ornata]|uniref:Uncharacterized protein n=1 Tax=Westerdykella ornata TaxID=318751 RepID=A0A6A6J7Z7_WESOR|nr:uncharacterized protein EI97DRAFT_385579 [Westerdykella ornata]KAF2272515.1 hypothetical protein EI97DRAFT_385579 [Westerdykella ornata]